MIVDQIPARRHTVSGRLSLTLSLGFKEMRSTAAREISSWNLVKNVAKKKNRNKKADNNNYKQLTKTEQFVHDNKNENQNKIPKRKTKKKHVCSAVKLTFYGLTKLHFSCCQSKKKKNLSGNTHNDEARRNLSSSAIWPLMESKTLSSSLYL